MRRGLSRRVSAVMAARTTSGNRTVINPDITPVRGDMTVITGVTAGNMCRMLTGRRRTVVAATAGTDHRRMIHTTDHAKAAGHVAIFTSIRTVDVLRVLAGGFYAIVATCAAAGDTAVIKPCPLPAVGVVAIVTGIAALNVV